ncbi:hypothetical protein Tco_0786134 [Tanacetum coccineum]
MANLEFCEKHNIVAYLKKTSGSEGFQEIVDFLNVDGKEFTVTEASVRRHLQLADVDGISVLPTTKFFDQLSLMEPIPKCLYQLTQPKDTNPRQALNHVIELPQTSEPIPNVPDEAIYEKWDDIVERATTTAASLDAKHASGGSPRCQEAMGVPLLRLELTVLCTNLSKKVDKLEANLKQTKQVYDAAYTKLIMKVKKLEKAGRMIEEIDQDAGVTLVTPTKGEDQPEDQLGVLSAAKVLADAAKTNVHTYTRRRRVVSTGSGGISTAEESVSPAGASMPVSTVGMVQEVKINIPSPVVVKDKAAVRLQEELDEEERQRMARVHEAAQSFTEEEWENIRARVEADEELSKRLQAEERNKYSEVDQAKMLVDLINQRKKYFAAQKAKAKRNKPMTQAQQRNYMINYIKHMGSHTLQQLKRYSFDELKELFETTMKNVNTFVPMETEDSGRASELAAGSSQATIIDFLEVGSSKRAAEAELDHEGSKRQKTNEALRPVQEKPEEEEKEVSQEDLQQMMMVAPVEEVYIKALQVKYPIINWEVYTKESRKYWKIIIWDDLVMLWNLVKERFSSTEPTDDKERTL